MSIHTQKNHQHRHVCCALIGQCTAVSNCCLFMVGNRRKTNWYTFRVELFTLFCLPACCVMDSTSICAIILVQRFSGKWSLCSLTWMPGCLCNCTVYDSSLVFVYVWAHVRWCVFECVLSMTVFFHSTWLLTTVVTQAANHQLWAGVCLYSTRLMMERFYHFRRHNSVRMCANCKIIKVLTPDWFFSQGRQKLARFNAREFATLIIDILSDAKRRQQGKGLSSPTGETLGGRLALRAEGNFKTAF